MDEIRYLKLNELGSVEKLSTSRNIDMSKVPPFHKSLEKHIKRVNLQVSIWNNSNILKSISARIQQKMTVTKTTTEMTIMMRRMMNPFR